MKYLKDGGFMAVEIGIYQAEPVKQMAIDNGWQNIEIIKDYAGIDRVVLDMETELNKNKFNR